MQPRLLQLPFLRFLTDGGRFAVALFFILSGYVCSIKPIKLMRSGRVEEMRNMVGKSAYKRMVRLVMPATIATFLNFLAVQLGLAYYGQIAPEQWLRYVSGETVAWGYSITRLVFSWVSPLPSSADTSGMELEMA